MLNVVDDQSHTDSHSAHASPAVDSLTKPSKVRHIRHFLMLTEFQSQIYYDLYHVNLTFKYHACCVSN